MPDSGNLSGETAAAGASRDIHRFIIYQYGKVGSTSLSAALNQLPGAQASATHFLGEKAFREVFDRLLDPRTPQYFFEHESGQLFKNLRIHRQFLRRDIDPGALTVVSLAREPFDWFRSAFAQDLRQHLEMLRAMLARREIACADDGETVTAGLGMLLAKIAEAIELFGDLDKMCEGDRHRVLRKGLEHVNREDFRQFMHFLHLFLRPHIWFRNHFVQVLGFDLREMECVHTGVYRHRQDWGSTYVLRYESMEDAARWMFEDLGFDELLSLPRANVSADKPLAREIRRAFESPQGAALRALCHSADTRFLGYAEGESALPG